MTRRSTRWQSRRRARASTLARSSVIGQKRDPSDRRAIRRRPRSATRRAWQTTALLEARVQLESQVRGRGEHQLSAVERPKSEAIDDVLTPQTKAERAVEIALTFQVGVHHVQRRFDQAWDVRRRVGVALLWALTKIGIETHPRFEGQRRAERPSIGLQVVQVERQCLRVAPSLNEQTAVGTLQRVELRVEGGVDLGRERARLAGQAHAAQREADEQSARDLLSHDPRGAMAKPFEPSPPPTDAA